MAIVKYGLIWPEKYKGKDLYIELDCFQWGTQSRGGQPDNLPLHFKNIVAMLWGPKSKKHFEWNPWNEKMLDRACKRKRVGLSGCAASGKSVFGAMWAIVNWLADPVHTLCLVTSTSISESRMRIWGAIETFWQATCRENGTSILPGKLVQSLAKIRTVDGENTLSDQCGIHLIAGERAKLKENIGKLIGAHQKRVFLICDEMPELSPALTEAADSNLVTNQYFQGIYIGNFKSVFDPFGEVCEPKAGWGSINAETSDEWETAKGGVCLRFDGLKSPNILLGDDRYKGIYSDKHREEQQSALGEHSSGFWRMARSFPCPDADADRIYSEADFLKAKATETVKWTRHIATLSTLDPAFVTGGDRAMRYVGILGETIEGKIVLQVTKRQELKDDVRIRDESKVVQVAKGFKRECEADSIMPRNAGYDGSGGGIAFGGLLSEIWSNQLLGIQFGGSASARIATSKDKRPAKDAYVNRVTELWFAGVEFLQSGQLKGIPKECIRELIERRYETVKSGNGLRIKVETKDDMKARTKGISPDDADAFLMLIELARERYGFTPVGMEGKRGEGNVHWKEKVKRSGVIYNQDHMYEAEEVEA